VEQNRRAVGPHNLEAVRHTVAVVAAHNPAVVAAHNLGAVAVHSPAAVRRSLGAGHRNPVGAAGLAVHIEAAVHNPEVAHHKAVVLADRVAQAVLADRVAQAVLADRVGVVGCPMGFVEGYS